MTRVPRKERNKPHREARWCTCCWSFSVYVQSTDSHTDIFTLWSFFCHVLNSCSKASPNHPIHQPPSPSPSSFFFFFSLISMKVTLLSLHPSTRTPPRSSLTVAHSRQCQAEIIPSVKLSNEARDTDAPKNKRTPELWESTLAFEEWWGVVGRIKWMKWKGVFVFMPQFIESVSSNIWRLQVQWRSVCVF